MFLNVWGADASATLQTELLCVAPLQVKRWTLHRQNPQKGCGRPEFGGTMHLGEGVSYEENVTVP